MKDGFPVIPDRRPAGEETETLMGTDFQLVRKQKQAAAHQEE